MMKRMAGADTTKAGEPDYSLMFLRLMHKLGSMKQHSPEKMGEKSEYKGISG